MAAVVQPGSFALIIGTIAAGITSFLKQRVLLGLSIGTLGLAATSIWKVWVDYRMLASPLPDRLYANASGWGLIFWSGLGLGALATVAIYWALKPKPISGDSL